MKFCTQFILLQLRNNIYTVYVTQSNDKNILHDVLTAVLMLSSCVEASVLSWQMNCDVLFSSDDKLFYADGPPPHRIRGPKPTVLVPGVTKSPRSADCR